MPLAPIGTSRRSGTGRRALSLLFAMLVVAGAVGISLPESAHAAIRPAAAGSTDPIAVAAADALAALWAKRSDVGDRLAVLVPLVAEAAKVSEGDLASAWSRASRRRMLVLLSALTQIGVPYRSRSATPGVG